MAATEVNARWQADMTGFSATSTAYADEGMRPEVEVFHLD